MSANTVHCCEIDSAHEAIVNAMWAEISRLGRLRRYATDSQNITIDATLARLERAVATLRGEL